MPTTKQMLGVGALTAWVILWVASLVANYKFGYSLGNGEVEKQLVGWASVASDFFKAACLPIFFMAIAAHRYWSGTVSVLVGAIAIVYSVVACTGFIATTRLGAYDRIQHEALKTEDKKSELARAKAKRDWGAQARPVAVVQAAIAAKEADLNYRRTRGCKRVWKSLTDWCREYEALKIELATAKEAIKAEIKVSKSRDAFYSAETRTDDYQIKFWADWFNLKPETVLLIVTTLAVVLIEVGSTFGLTIALAMLVPKSKVGSAIVEFYNRLKRKRSGHGPDNSGGPGGGRKVTAPEPIFEPGKKTVRVVPQPQPPKAAVAQNKVVRRFRLPPEDQKILRTA